MKPLVSVIIVTYNQEQTIARAIESVLNQICDFNYEIILGEDCSTDNTRNICIEYAKKHPNIIKLQLNKKNKGVLDNYFDCFLSCAGKYIADCAGDDFWIDTHKLQKQVSILESDSSLSAVHTDWYFYDPKSKTTRPSDATGKYKQFRRPKQSGKELLIPILTQKEIPIIHTCTTMYRADIVQRAYEKDVHLFRCKEFSCEDLQLTFILALNGNIAFLDVPTLCYTIRDNSISNTLNETKQFEFSLGVSKLCQYIASNYNIQDPILSKFLQENLFKLLMHIFRSKLFNLISLVDTEAKQIGGYNFKCKTLHFIITNKILYYPSKFIRDIIVYLKQLILK